MAWWGTKWKPSVHLQPRAQVFPWLWIARELLGYGIAGAGGSYGGGLGFAVGLGRGLTAPFSGVSVSYAIMVAVRWTRQVRGREDTVAWRRERPDARLEPDLGGVGSRLGCGLFPGPEAADLGFI